MRAALSRTIIRLLFVVAGLAPVMLFGCSSAGRMLVARHLQTRSQFDLMPAPAPGKPAAPVASIPGFEASGPLYPSPDGKWVAFEFERDGVHGVWVAQPDGERARRLSGRRIALRPRWSPDGTRLSFIARDARRPDAWDIWIADLDEAAPRKLPTGGSVSPAGPAWFPDSRHLCYGSDNWLIVMDTSTNATRAFRLPHQSAIVGVPAASPDGRRIVFAVEAEGAWMVSLDEGSITQVVAESDVDAFAWAPGSGQIAFRNARDGQWKVRIVK